MDCYLYVGGRRLRVEVSLEGVDEAFREDPLKPLWLVRGYVEDRLGPIREAWFMGASFRRGAFRLRYLVESERGVGPVELAYVVARRPSRVSRAR